MTDIMSMRRECQYGVPAADQILFNRFYVTGYSYYYRQAKWTLQIIDPPVVDPDDEVVRRSDSFRRDFRVPAMFRAEKADYKGSGFDRGHLVASADQRDVEIQNLETFLLTNMAPQRPELNRRIWRDLEIAVRELNDRKDILVTYVVTGPIFYFDKPTKVIGAKDKNEVTIPIPHAFYKSILTENNKGRFYMWSFILENGKQTKTLDKYQVTTTTVEKLTGMILWDQLLGEYISWEKSRIRKMW